MFRNRWLRRVAIGAAVVLVLALVGVIGYRQRTSQRGKARYAEVVGQLDANDPGWRLDTPPPHAPVPDEQNSARIVPRTKGALSGRFEVRRADGRYIHAGPAPNRTLDDEGWAAIDRAFEGNYAALAIARTFKDHPHGWRTPPPGRDLVNFKLDDAADTRMVLNLLNEEAKRLARDGRPGAALELVRAMLNATRSIDGEIIWLDALVHCAGDAMVAGRVQWLLAQTQPHGGLAPLQAALAEEAESDFLWRGFRGERALQYRTLENLRAGKYRYKSILALEDEPTKPFGLKEQAQDRLELPYLPGDMAAFLDLSTRVCDIGKLPVHRQRAAMRGIVDSLATLDRPKQAKQAYAWADKLLDAGLRVKALLRCAVVGVALERCRLQTGNWPAMLEDIPKDILAATPADPFDGQPLRYRHRGDGVTVYSIGQDEQDNGGEPGENGAGNKPGTDVCFRLYDPAQRGLPPLPSEPRVELDLDDQPIKPAGPPIGPAPRLVAE